MSFKTSLLESGLVGHTYNNLAQEASEVMLSNWESTGLLEGFEGDNKRNMAIIFENQAKDMIHQLNESNTSFSSGSYETVAFPVVRRAFAKLLANEIVSVQAMTRPVGRLYFMNPKISLRNADGTHTPMDGAYSNAAQMAASARTQFSSNSLYDQFYQTDSDSSAGLFDISKGSYTTVTLGVTPVNFVNGTSRIVRARISGFTQTNRGKLVGPAGIESDTHEFLASLEVYSNAVFTNPSSATDTIASGTPLIIRKVAMQYGQPLVDASGNYIFEIDLSAFDAIGTPTLAYNSSLGTGTTFTAKYRQYSNLEEDSRHAEIKFDMDYVTVDVGGGRMIRGVFTPQLQQDIDAFHKIDIEAELVSMLSTTMANEVDREILRDLRNGAAWQAQFDASGFYKRVKTGAFTGSKKDYNQELITVIDQVSRVIAKTTGSDGANWIVVSAEVAAILNDLEYFYPTNAAPSESKFSLGISHAGTLKNRYNVYVDNYAPESSCLIGLKGEGIYNAGYIYAPYIPLTFLPKLQNPNDHKTVLAVMTRYAKAMVNPRFYGKVVVKNTGVSQFVNGGVTDFIS